jgi:hypothetical protein
MGPCYPIWAWIQNNRSSDNERICLGQTPSKTLWILKKKIHLGRLKMSHIWSRPGVADLAGIAGRIGAILIVSASKAHQFKTPIVDFATK